MPCSAALRADLEAAIALSRDQLFDLIDLPLVPGLGPRRRGLAVKYVPAAYARTYMTLNSGLYIGINDYTWGRGVYVTSVNQPLSTAIYGRVGVVGNFDPYDWRVFDARDPDHLKLYSDWLANQPNYDDAILTVHSTYWFHFLRNTFREEFKIDCVLFHPDELDQRQRYTRQDDTWLVVSDWSGDYLRTGYSDRFTDVRLVIVSEEEFVADTPAFTRKAQLELTGFVPNHATVSRRVTSAYRRRSLVRLRS